MDWIQLIRNDDNFKNILQVMIQKEFKVTPDYMEVEEHNAEQGYSMGVYLCLGQPFHSVSKVEAIPINQFSKFVEIHQYMSEHSKVLILLGNGSHKIKKKAEQMGCESAARTLQTY